MKLYTFCINVGAAVVLKVTSNFSLRKTSKVQLITLLQVVKDPFSYSFGWYNLTIHLQRVKIF